MEEKKEFEYMVAKADALMAAPLEVYLANQKKTVEVADRELNNVTKRYEDVANESQSAREKAIREAVFQAFKDLGWEEK